MRTMNPKFSQTMTPKQSYKSAMDRARQGRQEAMQQVRSMPKGAERQAARQQAMDSFRSAVKSARDQRRSTGVTPTDVRPDPRPQDPSPQTGGDMKPMIDRGPIRPENVLPSRPAGFQDMSTMASAPMSTPPAPMKKGGKASVVKTASKGRKCDW